LRRWLVKRVGMTLKQQKMRGKLMMKMRKNLRKLKIKRVKMKMSLMGMTRITMTWRWMSYLVITIQIWTNHHLIHKWFSHIT